VSPFREAYMAEHYLEFNIPQWVEIHSKDLFVKVYSDGKLFGTLKVSKGSIDWSPAKSTRKKPHVIFWHEFDQFARHKRRYTRVLSEYAP
jgi:hypothetical protein